MEKYTRTSKTTTYLRMPPILKWYYQLKIIKWITRITAGETKGLLHTVTTEE
jgi:hypothetical protein